MYRGREILQNQIANNTFGYPSDGRPSFGVNPLSVFNGGRNGFWYDISDLRTLYQDVAGTTPVTADGQQVQLILDKSGNGNHASQLAGATYHTDGTLHWLDANGTTNYYDLTRLTFSSVVTALHCVTPDDVTNPKMVHGDGIVTTKKLGFFSGNHFLRVNTLGRNTVPASVLTNYVTGYSRAPDNVINNYVDSVAIDTYSESGSNNISTLLASVENLVIGQFFDGKYYGGFAVERALSDSEISSMSKYLAGLAGRTL